MGRYAVPGHKPEIPTVLRARRYVSDYFHRSFGVAVLVSELCRRHDVFEDGDRAGRFDRLHIAGRHAVDRSYFSDHYQRHRRDGDVSRTNQYLAESSAEGLTEKSTLIGLASGLFLGASVVFFRGAALSLNYDGYIMAAAYTLAISVVIQTILMGIYLLWREPGQMTAVLKNWVWAGAVGVAGVLGSIAWFTAFTLENAALVRAVGQIELVFTFMASVMIFREKSAPLEVVGILLVIAGILLILFVH